SALAARAGVLTGEAAVTLGAEGQGMVAGDLVNTAARIQSIAEPGAVLVGETTKRATEAAIAYDEAGEHELKGKAEPVALFRARPSPTGRLPRWWAWAPASARRSRATPPSRSCAPRSICTYPTATSVHGSSHAWPTCSGSARRRRPTGRSSSRPGGSSSSVSPS